MHTRLFSVVHYLVYFSFAVDYAADCSAGHINGFFQAGTTLPDRGAPLEIFNFPSFFAVITKSQNSGPWERGWIGGEDACTISSLLTSRGKERRLRKRDGGKEK